MGASSAADAAVPGGGCRVVLSGWMLDGGRWLRRAWYVQGAVGGLRRVQPDQGLLGPRSAPQMCAMGGHGCALLQGSIYAVGGVSWIDAQRQPVAQANSIEANATRACEVYCPQKTDWQSCSSLNIPRSGSRVAALGNRYLAAVAGSSDINSPSLQKTVEIFDLERGAWYLLATPLAVPRAVAVVAAIDSDRFFVAGGVYEWFNVGMEGGEVYRVASPGETSALAVPTMACEGALRAVPKIWQAVIAFPRPGTAFCEGTGYPRTD